MTVAELRNKLANLPDSLPVMVDITTCLSGDYPLQVDTVFVDGNAVVVTVEQAEYEC